MLDLTKPLETRGGASVVVLAIDPPEALVKRLSIGHLARLEGQNILAEVDGLTVGWWGPDGHYSGSGETSMDIVNPKPKPVIHTERRGYVMRPYSMARDDVKGKMVEFTFTDNVLTGVELVDPA